MAELGRKAFVCGHPIAHSRSPRIHNYWLGQNDIDGTYDAVDVAPADFQQFLSGLKVSGLIGGNVTLPHKEAAFALAGRSDEIAEAVGAANTLWLEDDVLCASNTDAYGFAANLDDQAPGWDANSEVAVVLGAGGASRAVLYALGMRGFRDIRIVNRTVERAKSLADRFGARFSAHPMEAANALLADAALLVNTSAAGMHGRAALTIDLGRLRDDAIVTDIVYVPLETPLLASARARALKTVDGLGMLLHQAVPGFERWFGIRPLVTPELRSLIEADLAKS